MVTVRTFAATDAEPVQLIMRSCTGELRTVYVPKLQPKIASGNDAPAILRIVAVDQADTVVGVAECIARPTVLYVQGVAVDPAHRRRGVAGALLAHIVMRALEMGLPVLQLATIKEAGNVDVFKRLGFSVVEEQKSERFLGQHGQPIFEVTLERYVS
jgi:N-acetylglutamate synthase-like GNAT family acetyltransferase